MYGQLIVDLAATHRLPAVYAYAALVHLGGLAACYLHQRPDGDRRASYIDWILRGAVVGDLPVQASEPSPCST